MSNHSSSLQSFVDGGSQHLIGGILVSVGVLHFLLWTQRGDGVLFLRNVEGGQLVQATAYGQEYLTAHPAYPLLVVVGLIVIVRATRS